MSQENVEIVRRIYEGWANGDFSVGVDDLDRHLTFIVSPDFPAFGVFVGLEETANFMRDFLAQWERATFEAERLQAVGDTVLAHVVQHSKGKASGIEGDLRYFQLFTFRGKKIVRIESMMDERDALEAAGLSKAMPQENVEIVRPIYAAWERGDFSSAEWAHPDIEFVIADSFEAGSQMGLVGMAQAWHDWLSAWEEYRVEVDEYRRLDDERILVLMLHCGRGKTSGLDVGQIGTKRAGANVLHVRDGRVTRLVLYWDRERALADLGLNE